jgi:hypothetical protein
VKRGDGHPESALSKELAGGDDADESDLSCQGEGMDGPCLFFFGAFVVVVDMLVISIPIERESVDVMTIDPPANQPNRNRSRVMCGLADVSINPVYISILYI